MASVSSYSHITVSTIHKETWDEAWFSIMSWKGYLQSFPGFLQVRLAAREMENQDIRFHVVTVWEYVEQLEEWVKSKWSAESLLKSLPQSAYDIVTEAYEDLG